MTHTILITFPLLPVSFSPSTPLSIFLFSPYYFVTSFYYYTIIYSSSTLFSVVALKRCAHFRLCISFFTDGTVFVSSYPQSFFFSTRTLFFHNGLTIITAEQLSVVCHHIITSEILNFNEFALWIRLAYRKRHLSLNRSKHEVCKSEDNWWWKTIHCASIQRLDSWLSILISRFCGYFCNFNLYLCLTPW